ncbi:MAG: hypothetical protein JXR73_10630 [Candidatus Omnitrophica bacterium]|nr:hypothetical protein [Candidatus Omnitrophota bacterium]
MMTEKKTVSDGSFPLVFGMETAEWKELHDGFRKAIQSIVGGGKGSYKKSKEAAASYFETNALDLPRAVRQDEDAKAVLDAVFEAQEELVRTSPGRSEAIRRAGRHVREFLADFLLEKHLNYLDEALQSGEEGAQKFADELGASHLFESAKSLERFRKKIDLYRQVGSFVHTAELSLSTVKVKTRASARAQRGNLWANDRREKYRYLEDLADSGKVIPSFTEEDLEFLVSQSSLDMLKKKATLLLQELKYVEPNRLKANYSRLRDHLQRSNQRHSDFERRRELLIKLGATPEQVDYISARATYQTMKNLLKLANGRLAISDLMGGKRTIRKLLRRRGQAQSKAEIAISRYLIHEEGISRSIAESYARTRKNHSIEHLRKTLDFLKENYQRFYRNHWGFSIHPNVLRRALELGLSRQKLSKRALTTKDFINDLRRALSLEEAQLVKEQNHLSADDRRTALAPLKEVLDYETDTFTRKQLYFIYEQFCRYGLCIPKDKLKQICLKNSGLFPSVRKVQDALEILNSAYRAVGQHGEHLCVLPDYLELPKEAPVHSYKQTA